MKRISILGLGFVGLSSAVYLARKGYDVIASSNERRKAQLVRKGIPPLFEPKLLDEVISINAAQSKHMVELAEEELGSLAAKKIAVLGLSFKPDTDDIREAPSVKVISMLLTRRAEVAVFDPLAMGNVREIFADKLDYPNDVSECLRNADCCLLLTEWNAFKKLRPHDFTLMRTPLLIDGRRIYKTQAFSKKLRFRAIGLSKVQSEAHD